MSGGRGLRLTGGTWRGRRIRVPHSARPTTERVREAIWARWHDRVLGARMLDLYAGSGAMSLEALSRGAAHCLAVEESVQALRLLQRNASELGAQIETVKASLPDQWRMVSRRLRGPVDLIFLDPPYDCDISASFLAELAEALTPDGRVAVEHSSRQVMKIPEQLEIEDGRRYGETTVTYLRQP